MYLNKCSVHWYWIAYFLFLCNNIEHDVLILGAARLGRRPTGVAHSKITHVRVLSWSLPMLTSLYFLTVTKSCHTPVWVPGLRIDPLRLLAGCRKRRLNQAPFNLRGLTWLPMMVWSKRGNINTASLVTISQCNTLVARCSRPLIGPADWVFVTLDPYSVISLEAVAYS